VDSKPLGVEMQYRVGTRVKVESLGKNIHPLEWQVGTIEGLLDSKTYLVRFGHSSLREVEEIYLCKLGGSK